MAKTNQSEQFASYSTENILNNTGLNIKRIHNTVTMFYYYDSNSKILVQNLRLERNRRLEHFRATHTSLAALTKATIAEDNLSRINYTDINAISSRNLVCRPTTFVSRYLNQNVFTFNLSHSKPDTVLASSRVVVQFIYQQLDTISQATPSLIFSIQLQTTPQAMITLPDPAFCLFNSHVRKQKA